MLDNLADMRREYTRGGLERTDLNDDPIVQFELWLKDMIKTGLPDPTAMTVATVDKDGQPSQRIVLLKDVSHRGFVFYTNTGSRKANELSANNKISLHFPWHLIERQVKVCGRAVPLSTLEVSRYFLSRPRESQIAAWASEQSRPISTRQVLIGKFQEMKDKFAKGEIPLPSFWGGYLVVPHEIEFWQGGEHRLHDRFVYRLQAEGQWAIERLMP
ncbi:pyridoxamine 5'-phosphate oxidase [Aliiglaciecola sp. CAU 1673]|uniref:pyridoxamine 5'-phosphate oxidase n=1 Tax=Aliiglaciecola sp. CAU 1673 TaxID=3032595 RepID=UPI0023DAD11A|nr:pyridoxamine 5'-phosphate oxidase [Aliiglaciecola sp. CAU 1673]MDF2178002.1 pyridoxamine 5'-phosphate oxidase [Aliiglaciecola sp. CAU 1673]